MKKFGYSFWAKLIYRFANFPISFLLIFYLFVSLVGMIKSWIYVFPFAVNALILFFMNRFYFKSYKLFPYKIEANNEKLVCADFFMSDKKVEIYHSDITEIRGGLFSGQPIRPVYVTDGKQNLTIGFNSHLKGYNELITIILSNIEQDLYAGILDAIKEMAAPTKKNV
ncbi:MAG: hypothetical protein GXO87_11485 [Chlorobi bacterium]|nr:hypothetical protein [Chlorobiota bacterium]